MDILIAGHPDDELIGAFRLIKSGLIDGVVYLDATPERYALAQVAGKELGFDTRKLNFSSFCNLFQCQYSDYPNPGVALAYDLFGVRNSESTFLVPDIADNHLLHKAVNCIMRLGGCRLGYYTTEMNTGYTKELSEEEKNEKREMLNKYYPDQASLWENDWKYFLFEGIVYDALTPPTTL